MRMIHLILSSAVFGLAGCAALAPPTADLSAEQPAGTEDASSKWFEEFPATRSMPEDLSRQWISAAETLYEAAEIQRDLQETIETNPAARRTMSKAMTEWVAGAYFDGPVPEKPEGSDVTPSTADLVSGHDPGLVFSLISPSLKEAEPLENALIEGDPELARMFENPGRADSDPGFSLYLEIIDAEGLESPLSQPLIRRMIYIRPTRAMDLLLERYGAEVPEAMMVLGILQGIRRQQMRESLGDATAQETLDWMARTLSPLQGHELWWVRYYARRILEIQVSRAPGAEATE